MIRRTFLHALRDIFSDNATPLRGKVTGIYSVLILFNILTWVWAFAAFHGHPTLLGTALLAYSFGLRHAVDADHIAAIDNVTRKLMQQGKRPVSVGLMFSLGHSSIVVAACVAIAAAAYAFQHQLEAFKAIGGIIGTSVSSLFLLLIAMMNIAVLRSIWRAFKDVRNGKPYQEEDFDLLLGNRGFFSRLFRPMFNMISKSWHMYPLGVLFGLGFDTATEIGLMSISASQAAQGLSPWAILVFPVLFTAGMTLIDTTDSILMLGAYGWAFIKPIRKLYYNLTITLVSVLVAVVIGSVEGLGLLADKLQLTGGIWDIVGELNDSFGTLGYFIVGIFAFSWVLSVVIYKLKRYDDLELNR